MRRKNSPMKRVDASSGNWISRTLAYAMPRTAPRAADSEKFKCVQQMRHMLEKKDDFRRGLATLMRHRQAPQERNVLRVALPKHQSSIRWALVQNRRFHGRQFNDRSVSAQSAQGLVVGGKASTAQAEQGPTPSRGVAHLVAVAPFGTLGRQRLVIRQGRLRACGSATDQGVRRRF